MHLPTPQPLSEPVVLALQGVAKHFFLHQRSSTPFPVLQGINFSVSRGECLVLEGSSGMGKSSLLKMIFGNYKASAGHIFVRTPQHTYINVARGDAREILQLRAVCINYVSQFLRVIPRVGAFELIRQEARLQSQTSFLHSPPNRQEPQEPQDPQGQPSPSSPESQEALDSRVENMLKRLQIAPRLWHLPPATFSGGEQQRINLAMSLINPKPLLLLDEPTASLDPDNAAIVIELINEQRQQGSAILGIFHDTDVKEALATRTLSMHDFQPKL
jgi:alpha-D-ribose 1-methylphosphonate 5-triphosphate synthase subunit PhnL